MTETAVKTMSLDEAKEQFVKTTNVLGFDREIIGAYIVSREASVMPWMTDEEFIELQISIGQNGLLDRVELNANDEVVDGRNRLLACLAVGVEPDTKYAEVTDEVSLVDMRNLRRRNLNPGVRAMLYLRLVGEEVEVESDDDDELDADSAVESSEPAASESPETVEGELSGATELNSQPPVEHTPASSTKNKRNKTIPEMAREAGTSPRVMSQAKNVHDKGTASLKDAVINEDVPVGQADVVARTKTASEQDEFVSDRKAGRSQRPPVSEAMFNLEAFVNSVERLLSKKMANIPQGSRDVARRRLAESMGATVRLERETADLMNAESVVPYVEQLVKEMAKTERSGAEKALAERYGNVIVVKDADQAMVKIEAIANDLSDREKKKLMLLLLTFSKASATKPAEYMPVVDEVDELVDLFGKELTHRADCLKGHAKFLAAQSEAIVDKMQRVAKRLTLKKES